jgi:hypothetical protein
MASAIAPTLPTVFWHRQLPPLSGEPGGEHTLEASSRRVPLIFSRDDEEWARCYADLMAQAQGRLEQEVARLDGDYAHVRREVIHPRHDAAAGEAWLYGRFDYVLYRDPGKRIGKSRT